MLKSKLILLLASLLIILFGCATPYKDVGISGGFIDHHISVNEFRVVFAGNGFTNSQRASDLSLLRCADLANRGGYNYFMIYDASDIVDTSTSITTTSFIPTGYGTGMGFGTTTPIYKPVSATQIVCFKSRPKTKRRVFNVSSTISDLSRRYGIKKDFPRGLINVSSLNNIVWRNADLRTEMVETRKVPPPIIILHDKNTMATGSANFFAVLSVYDDYFSSEEKFEEFLKLSAEKFSANIVQVISDQNEIRSKINEGRPIEVYPYYVILLGVREPSIGVIFQPGLLDDKIYEVRSFMENTLAKESGLKIGDRILAVDGIDTLSHSTFNLGDKAAGDTVILNIARDKEELEIPVVLSDGWKNFHESKSDSSNFQQETITKEQSLPSTDKIPSASVNLNQESTYLLSIKDIREENERSLAKSMESNAAAMPILVDPHLSVQKNSKVIVLTNLDIVEFSDLAVSITTDYETYYLYRHGKNFGLDPLKLYPADFLIDNTIKFNGSFNDIQRLEIWVPSKAIRIWIKN